MTATTVKGRDQITAATVNGIATANAYLGETQTTRLTATTGGSTTSYRNTMLGLTGQSTSGAGTNYIRTPDGQLIGTTGANAAYFLTDNLGSTVGTVSTSGAKTAGYSYDPYGRTRTATGANVGNTIRYAGGIYNATTGTTKFGARYYDPNIGRFTQPDPSGQEQNPYAYVRSSPVTLTDPTGLYGWDDFWTSAGQTAGAFVGGALFTAGCVATAGAVCVVAGAVGASLFSAVGGGLGARATGGDDEEVTDAVIDGALFGPF